MGFDYIWLDDDCSSRCLSPTDFPIAEIFGYHPSTDQARGAQEFKRCPFSNMACEKYRQYGLGYCSVNYAAAGDRGKEIYAVCDHRLDGPPVHAAIDDRFGATPEGIVRIASEVVLHEPRISFDYVALREHGGVALDAVAIETQTVDLRGGGVGPAFRAWADGHPADWREYFTEESVSKGRKDTLAYGVNLGNVYKRLAIQIVEKGTYLKSIGVPLYVVMQDRVYQYLVNRACFAPAEQTNSWDICFMTFEYEDVMQDGALVLTHRRTIRTGLDSYLSAMTKNNRADDPRQVFFRHAYRKSSSSCRCAG